MADAFFDSINMIYTSKWFWLFIALIVGWIFFGGIVIGLVGAVVTPHNNAAPTIQPIRYITPTPTPMPEIIYNPDEWNGPGHPGSGHQGVRIAHYKGGETAIISLNVFTNTGGKVEYRNESQIDQGDYMPATMNYVRQSDGKTFTWFNSQTYYDRKLGVLITDLKADDYNMLWPTKDSGLLNGYTEEKKWIDAGRLW